MWIEKISYHQGIRDETPNKELSRLEDHEGIREISSYLYDKNKSIASDCLAVLYTIGYEKPELIQEYADTFLDLLKSKNNRMVWGGIIALANIAPLMADQLFKQIDLILDTIKKGTVITEVWGLKTLVSLSLANDSYKATLLPVLFDYLEKCRPIDFATRVETIIPAITQSAEKEAFDLIIESKRSELSPGQEKKLNAVLKKAPFI